MSEFECKNGHLMGSGEIVCKECGGKLHKMDGYTANQWKRMEQDDNDRPEKEDEDGYDEDEDQDE